MNIRTEISIGLAALIAAFAFGRYTAPKVPAISQKVDDQKQEQVNTDKDVHKQTTITKKPDGTQTTVIVEDSTVKTEDKKQDTKKVDTTITPPKINTINLNALAGVDAFHSFKPVYGAQVSKQFIGPVSIGLFGLSNGTIGVSLGVSF